MKANEIYTAQSYIEEAIVEAKRANKDYIIYVARIADDDSMVYMLIDGNHSYQAAVLDGVEPEIIEVENESGCKTVEQYVTAFNDLSNPVNIVTKKELW